jgi:hypothetical protein
MTYKGGFPRFSIEKPFPVFWPSGKELLEQRQASGDYEAELKLNEHRGFITIDDKGEPTFFSYRHDNPIKLRGPALDHLKAMDLPPGSVFDGGHFSKLTVSKNSHLWIFDVLVLGGEQVVWTWGERRAWLDANIKPDPFIWVPLKTEDFVGEFQRMLNGDSLLVKQAALRYGIPYEMLVKEIEGLVLKRKSSKLTFPSSKKEVSSYFKLRLVDAKR